MLSFKKINFKTSDFHFPSAYLNKVRKVKEIKLVMKGGILND